MAGEGESFQFGPFLVDAQGRLSPRSPDVSPSFTFRWRDRPMRARLRSGGKLTMQATLGRVPSTATREGTADTEQRKRSFDALRALPNILPAGWRMILRADHRVLLEAHGSLDKPPTAHFVLTEVACFLLTMAPYLDALDEANILAPAWSAPSSGTAPH